MVMKIRTIPVIIAAGISGLVAFGLYFWCKTTNNQLILAIGAFISLFLTLALCIGGSFEGRTTINTATVSGLGFALLLISNIIFCFIEFSIPCYIIVNGILLLIILLILYGITREQN